MRDVKSFRSFCDVILLKRKSYPFVTGPQDLRYHGELARREVLKLALESQHVLWPHKTITGELWGRFTSDMDMVRYLSHECLRQAYERNIVSFESNLLDSLSIVLYVRKNVVAFYGPIFASCTSVPQKRCRSVLKHVLKRCDNRWIVSHVVGVSQTCLMRQKNYTV